jgi:hypothetical protein
MSEEQTTMKIYDVATICYERKGKKLKVTNATLRDEHGRDYPGALSGMINEIYEDEIDIQYCAENLVVEGIEDYLRSIGEEDKQFELTIELHLYNNDTDTEKMVII